MFNIQRVPPEVAKELNLKSMTSSMLRARRDFQLGRTFMKNKTPDNEIEDQENEADNPKPGGSQESAPKETNELSEEKNYDDDCNDNVIEQLGSESDVAPRKDSQENKRTLRPRSNIRKRYPIDSESESEKENDDFVNLKSAVIKLESITEKLTALNDGYEQFGKYVSSLLRGLPEKKGNSLKQKIVCQLLEAVLSHEKGLPEEVLVLPEPSLASQQKSSHSKGTTTLPPRDLVQEQVRNDGSNSSISSLVSTEDSQPSSKVVSEDASNNTVCQSKSIEDYVLPPEFVSVRCDVYETNNQREYIQNDCQKSNKNIKKQHGSSNNLLRTVSQTGERSNQSQTTPCSASAMTNTKQTIQRRIQNILELAPISNIQEVVQINPFSHSIQANSNSSIPSNILATSTTIQNSNSCIIPAQSAKSNVLIGGYVPVSSHDSFISSSNSAYTLVPMVPLSVPQSMGSCSPFINSTGSLQSPASVRMVSTSSSGSLLAVSLPTRGRGAGRGANHSAKTSTRGRKRKINTSPIAQSGVPESVGISQNLRCIAPRPPSTASDSSMHSTANSFEMDFEENNEFKIKEDQALHESPTFSGFETVTIKQEIQDDDSDTAGNAHEASAPHTASSAQQPEMLVCSMCSIICTSREVLQQHYSISHPGYVPILPKTEVMEYPEMSYN